MRIGYGSKLWYMIIRNCWNIYRLANANHGVTAIEYALIAALLAVAAIAAFTLVGTNLSTTFSTIAAQL